MIKNFSSGYYSIDMAVQPYEDGPVIDSTIYDYIDREIYASTDAPVTMKLSMNAGEYFNVSPENGVPPSVLAVPRSWVENFANEAGRRQQVYLLKPSYSSMFNQPNGGE